MKIINKTLLLLKVFIKYIKRNLSKKGILTSIILSYFVAVFLVVFTTQGGEFFPKTPPDYEVGDIALEDFIVDKDIEYIDKEETERRKKEKATLIPPVFLLNEDIAKSSIDSLLKFQEELLAAVKTGNTVGQMIKEIQFNFPNTIGKIGSDELSLLISQDSPEQIIQLANVLLDKIMYEEGFFPNQQELSRHVDNLFDAGSIELRQGRISNQVLLVDELITSNSLFDWLVEETKDMAISDVKKTLAFLLVESFVNINCNYNDELTKQKVDSILQETEVVTRKLVKGHILVRKGEFITEEILAQLKAYGETKITVNLNNIAGSALFLLAIVIIVAFIVSKKVFNISLTNKQAYFLIVSVLIFLFIASLLSQVKWEDSRIPFAVILPTSVFIILITIFISNWFGIVFSLIYALLLLLIRELDVYSFIFALISGIGGCASVQGAEKRIHLIRASIYLSLINTVTILIIGFLKNFEFNTFVIAIGWSLLNGFISGFFSLGFLPILEHILNVPTRYRLMELSDLNSPILKKMLSLAPGTFNHSISVANLAESACREIGANALLARVGAYYHDIGKIEQARYFIENQREYNKHDDLKPTLSAAIIKSHLKLGVEKAKELKLPQEVIDIIAQHHGKGLITYFYHRALSNKNKNESLTSDDFRYSGERPVSKEAAIVLMADAVEAASRTIKKPTIAKLESLVWSIIMDKFNTGELSRSQLTLSDLDKIKNSFAHVLAGYFHSRIEYPKKDEVAV